MASFKTKLAPLASVSLESTPFGFYSFARSVHYHPFSKPRSLEIIIIEQAGDSVKTRTTALGVSPEAELYLKRGTLLGANVLFHAHKATGGRYHLAKTDFLRAKCTVVTGLGKKVSGFELGTTFAAVKTKNLILRLTNLHSSKNTCRVDLRDLADKFYFPEYSNHPLRIKGRKLYAFVQSFRICQFDISTGRASFVCLRKFSKSQSLLDDFVVEVVNDCLLQIRQNVPIEVRLGKDSGPPGRVAQPQSCGFDFQMTGDSQKVILKSLFWDKHSNRLCALVTLCNIFNANPKMQFHVRIASRGSEFKGTVNVDAADKLDSKESDSGYSAPYYMYLLLSFDFALDSVQHCLFGSDLQLKILTTAESLIYFKLGADHGDYCSHDFTDDDEDEDDDEENNDSDDDDQYTDDDEERDEDNWDHHSNSVEEEDDGAGDRNESDDQNSCESQDYAENHMSNCFPNATVIKPKVHGKHSCPDSYDESILRVKPEWADLPAQLNVDSANVSEVKGTQN